MIKALLEEARVDAIVDVEYMEREGDATVWKLEERMEEEEALRR